MKMSIGIVYFIKFFFYIEVYNDHERSQLRMVEKFKKRPSM